MPKRPLVSPAPGWPFPTKNPGQYRRVDQGWDLQYAGTRPVPVLAVVPGTLRNAGPDPGGFGPGYPLLMLDTPVFGYPAIYYGHTFTDTSKVGAHVNRGEAIGQTGGLHSGGNAYPDSNWLEIGFWVNGPAAGGAAGASFPGQQMHDWLLGAAAPPPGGGGVVVAQPVTGYSPGAVVALTALLFAAGFGLLVLAGALVAAGGAWAVRKAAS